MPEIAVTADSIERMKDTLRTARRRSAEDMECKRGNFEKSIDTHIAENVDKRPKDKQE